MGVFDGILICTDLDGTLLRKDKTISKENIDAMEYFKSEGGIFTFVTGRMPYCAFDIHKLVNPNAPVGCVNGGGLYDYEAGRYVWRTEMSEGVNELIRCIDQKLPKVGIQVNTFERIYFSKENKIMERFRAVTKVDNLVRHYDDVKEPVAKIVFGCETEDDIMAVSSELKNHHLADKFGFIRSEKNLYEILPKGISKGTSIMKLCECLGLNKNKTIAIGDYNNDIPMFEAAKVGIAVKNACPEAISIADYVTVSNEDHAIANVIYGLEKGKYGGT